MVGKELQGKKAVTEYLGKWEGGYLIRGPAGKSLYIIRKQIQGKRYTLSTGCTTAGAAHDQLKRFQADPEAYSPRGADPTPALALDADLVAAFLLHQRLEKQNTAKWLQKQQSYLAWWAGKLEGQDLRAVTAKDLLEALKGKYREPARIRVVKSFFNWLRRTQQLGPGEGPDLKPLVITVPPPKQLLTSRVIPKEDLFAVRAYFLSKPELAHLGEAIGVQLATGWHCEEVARFASGGRIDAPPAAQLGQIEAVLVCHQLKARAPIKTGVSGQGKAAAQALRKHGSLSVSVYGKQIEAACLKLKITPWTPGSIRHTFSTWAIEAGSDVGSVSTFLNHKSATTLKKFYVTHAVPAKVPTLL